MSVVISDSKLSLKHRQKVGHLWVCSEEDDVFYYLTVSLLKRGETQGVYYQDGSAYCVKILDDREVATQIFDETQQDEIEAFFTYSHYEIISELDKTEPFELKTIVVFLIAALVLAGSGTALYFITTKAKEVTETFVKPKPKKKIYTINVGNYEYSLVQKLIEDLNHLIDKRGKAELWKSLRVSKGFKVYNDTRPRRLMTYVINVSFKALYPYASAYKKPGPHFFEGRRYKVVTVDPKHLPFQKPKADVALETIAKDPKFDVLSQWRFAYKTESWPEFRTVLNRLAALSVSIDTIQISNGRYFLEGTLVR